MAALLINQIVNATDAPKDSIKFLAGQAVAQKVDHLILDAALLKVALCFFRIKALILSENLDVQ